MSEVHPADPAGTDPTALLAALLRIHPQPSLIAGFADPPPDTDRRKTTPVLVVTTDEVDAIEAIGHGEVRLYLRDGGRLIVEGGIANLSRRLGQAGYPLEKPHEDFVLRTDRIDHVQHAPKLTRKKAPPPPAAKPPLVTPAGGHLVLDRVRASSDPESPWVWVGSEPTFPDPDLDDEVEIQSKSRRARPTRHRLVLPSGAPCPIGSSEAEDELVAHLASRTFPPIAHLDFPVPESGHAEQVRKQRLYTVGGSSFWELVLKPKPTEAEKPAREAAMKAYRLRWMIQLLPTAESLALFHPAGRPELPDKPGLMRNVIWQVHQWMRWGLIENITQMDEEEELDPDDVWWDEGSANIRTIWYRFGKGAVKKLGVSDELKDDDHFNDIMTDMARKAGLVRYSDYGLLDGMADRRVLGDLRPELLVVTEKTGMAAFTASIARRFGASHMALRGEPPHITMDYLTAELVDRLKAKGPLAGQTVHVFGICDFNAAGANILQSVVDDLLFYGRQQGLTKVEVHNLVRLEDMTDLQITRFRNPQVHYTESRKYLGGKKVTVRDFEEGSPSFLTRVLQWFKAGVNDPRFHESITLEEGLKAETYFGLDVDNHPKRLVVQRFTAALSKLGIPIPPELQVLAKPKDATPQTQRTAALLWLYGRD